MQLSAQNSQKIIVYAQNANKHQDYFCLECGQTVRLRKGIYRQPHFYHLTAERGCYQNGKSEEHIQIQMHIKQMFPEQECSLEHRFNEINRIADVVVWSQKLIFEVQCSFISASEVEKRNQDYRSIDFKVIWILHDKRYNKEKPYLSEFYLESNPHYFSNMSAEGKGIIYDQFSFIFDQKRIKLSEPIAIDLRQAFQLQNKVDNGMPKLIEKRLKTWEVYFYGDILSLYFENADRLASMHVLEKGYLKKKTFLWRKWMHQWVFRPYHLLFQILLEKSCR